MQAKTTHQVLLCCARTDDALCDLFLQHLLLLAHTGLVQIWHENQTPPGESRKEASLRKLIAVDFVLVLVSKDLFDSNNQDRLSIEEIMHQQTTIKFRVIPILLKPCVWRATPFGNLQVLPRNEKAVTRWTNREEAFSNIVDDFAKILTDPINESRGSHVVTLCSQSNRLTGRAGLLDRVERVCQLRIGERGQIRRRRAIDLAGEFLEVAVEDGGIVRVYPIAVIDADATLGRLHDFIDSIDNLYREDDPGLISVLVYTGSPAAEHLQREAGCKRIRLVSYIEYCGLIDFRRYVDRQIVNLEQDHVYPPGLYVRQCLDLLEPTTGQSDDALGTLELWIESSAPTFALVLGDFGSGKTFLLHQLALRVSQRKNHPIIPILIEMRQLEKQNRLDALIAQHFAQAGMERWDWPAFRYMLGEGRILLMFDGFDELALRVTYDRVLDHFETLMQAACGASKVIITSRSQYFRSDYQIRTALAERAAALPGYHVVKLRAFTPNQIRQFLINKKGDVATADNWCRLLTEIGDLQGLAANPRMLGFIAEIPSEQLRSAVKREGDFTAAKLYQALLERWLLHEYDRDHPKGIQPGLSVKDRWAAVTLLALRLWARGVESIAPGEVPDEIRAVLDSVASGQIDMDVAIHQVGTGTLLVRDSNGKFSFFHSSIMEWLVAKKIAEDLRACGDSSILGIREISELMVDFLVCLADRKAVLSWAKIQLTVSMIEVSKLSAVRLLRRLENEVWERSSLAGQDLRGKDLSRKNLRSTDLTQADLTDALLIEADLTGATLVGAKLIRANLSGAKLVQANLTDADASFARFLGSDLRGAKLDGTKLYGSALLAANIDTTALPKHNLKGAALPQAVHVEIEPREVLAGCSLVALQQDGAWIVSSYSDGAMWHWHISGEKLPRQVQKGTDNYDGVVNVFFRGPDTTTVSGYTESGLLIQSSNPANQEIYKLTIKSKISSLVISDTGIYAAVGYETGEIEILSLDHRKSLILRGHQDEVCSLAIIPTAHRIISCSKDGTIRSWSYESGEESFCYRCDPQIPTIIASSPCGKRIAVGYLDGRVNIFDQATSHILHTLVGHTGLICALSYSTDGSLIASGSADHTIRLWHTLDGTERVILNGHSDAVLSVAFSQTVTDKLIVSGSKDGTIRAWDSSAGLLQSTFICGVDGAWATIMRDGRYKCSENGRRLFWYKIGLCRFDPQEFERYWPSPLYVEHTIHG